MCQWHFLSKDFPILFYFSEYESQTKWHVSVEKESDKKWPEAKEFCLQSASSLATSVILFYGMK